MNFGIIGFGKIARKFVKSIEFTDGGNVVAIASKSLEEDDEYLQGHPEVAVHRDYQSLLEDSNVEAVYIALPHMYHYEWIIKALERKIPVLSEKPAVLTLGELEHVIQTARDNETYFSEAMKTRYNDGIGQLIDDLGMIGELKKIEANFCFDATFLKESGSYLFDQTQGGALYDVGPYLSAFTTALIDSDIQEISTDSRMDGNIPTYFQADIKFANGVEAVLEGAVDQNKERFALLTGTKGTIMIPMFNRITEYTIEAEGIEPIKKEFPIVGDDMTMEIAAVIENAAKGNIESPMYDFKEHLENMELLEAIKFSISNR